jgi:hypothetical protein
VAAAGDDAAGEASGEDEKKGGYDQATHGRSPLSGNRPSTGIVASPCSRFKQRLEHALRQPNRNSDFISDYQGYGRRS